MIDMSANLTEWIMETPAPATPRHFSRYKKKNECCDDNSKESKFCQIDKNDKAAN